MSKVILLEELKKFSLRETRDLLLPVRRDRNDKEEPAPRAANVFLMRVPEMKSAEKKAPYMLHQVLTGKDAQKPGERLPDATAVVRTVFCVYDEDGEKGAMRLLELMERLRTALLEQVLIGGGRYQLDLKEGLESLVYPDNADHPTTPYYLGEMISVWRLPPVKRLDAAQIIAYGWDPKRKGGRAGAQKEAIEQKGSD